ncbi:MAG: DNA helicase RecQ [Caldilineaceae bacterium]
MEVLIVAKTRQGSRACIGAIDLATGRSLRLIAADAEHNEQAGHEYQVGEVWTVEAEPPAQITAPHVENVVVWKKRRLHRHAAPQAVIFDTVPPVRGGPDQLFAGLLQHTSRGSLYIAARTGVPDHSTTFWVPDKPLTRVIDGDHVRIRYAYPVDYADAPAVTLTFVGFQDPPAEIPAGTLVRVSLAHWWQPTDHPEWEPRCFGQLSGWFDLPPAADTSMDRKDSMQSATPTLPPEAHATLKRVFGFDEFYPLQTRAIANVLDGRDTLLVLPTGGGKSLCYQLPALLRDGLTVVVSPLISLMQDQVTQLRENGVDAAFLNSSLVHADQAAVLQAARQGGIKLLYVAPETLLRPEVLLALEAANVTVFAVDEAHCISAWGHDFRPEYRQLAQVRTRFADAACIALTATATPRVQTDIVDNLALRDVDRIIGSFNRPNLTLAAALRVDDLTQLLAFLADHQDQSGIIYCSTRKLVDALTAALEERGWSARAYHAGLDAHTRAQNQAAWVRDDVALMIATVAFGMGIDKSNVRFIVHYNLPKSLENYYQEIGRAGRDGLPSDCLLLFTAQDMRTMRFFIDEGAEEERRGRELRLQAMLRFAQTDQCRRTVLLDYFGSAFTPPCDTCDNCLADPDDAERTDVTVAAQKFLSCVARTEQRFGITHVVNVLRGSQEKKLLQHGHDQLSTYGIGMEHSTRMWKELAQHFIMQGLLVQDPQYGSLQLTDKAWRVMKSELPVTVAVQQTRTSKTASVDYDVELFEILRRLRKELADAANVPPYVIFSDRSLVEMAAHFPQNDTQLLAMHGVGETKLDRYGAQFLDAIRGYSREHDKRWRPLTAQAAPAVSTPSPSLLKRRFEEVGERFAAGEPLERIRASYNVKMRTVIGHLATYVQAGHTLDADALLALSTLDPDTQAQVEATFERLGPQQLTPVFEALNGTVAYEELHLLRLVYLCRTRSIAS